MEWLYLAAAVFFWIAATILLKRITQQAGYSIPITYAMFIAYLICFGFMEATLYDVDFDMMYALWAGIGLIILTAIGVVNLGNPDNSFGSIPRLKVASLVLIILGVVGLNLGIMYYA